MGIEIEFNPDLALRSFQQFKEGQRKQEECLPDKLVAGTIYEFLKKGQRNYWYHGEVALLETKGNQQLSRPLASIKILEATHFLKSGNVWTKGKYQVIDVFDISNKKINFEWMVRV